MNSTAYIVMEAELQKIAYEGGFSQSQFSTPIEGPKPVYHASSLPPFSKPRPIVKKAFQTSQFSGPLSHGGFNQVSSLAPFTMPRPVVKAAPSSGLGRLADPRGGVQVKAAASGYGTTIASGSSPAQSLAITRRVGSGKLGAGPGPSIAQQVKPLNFGKGSPVGPNIPGAGKGGI